MASCNAVLKSESKSELRQVSNSAQAQHFSSLELLLDSYMPEMALSSKSLCRFRIELEGRTEVNLARGVTSALPISSWSCQSRIPELELLVHVRQGMVGHPIPGERGVKAGKEHRM